MEKNITVIKGDGIGPEIVNEALKVLDAIANKYNHKFNYTQILMGGASIDEYGVPLTDEALEIAKNGDSVLLGSIGGDTTTSPWYKLEPNLRPEAGLLKIRKELGLFANLRPAVLYDELKGACPLKEELITGGFDMMIMRELTGGLYFGKRSTKEENGQLVAYDSMSYSETEIRRIAKRAFDIAMKRNKKVTSVDKANVIDTSRLWRKVVSEVAKDYPEVTLEHMLVDNCAMQLVKDPKQFDVIVSNPPYIPKKDIETLHTQVKDYEPYNALEGGEDGLDFYRQITKESIDYLKQGGILAYEVGHDQAEDVSEIMKSYGYTKIYKKKDIQGIDRVVIGFKL